MAPDILYEICPGRWLVETELSHSNRELCIGRTLLVGRQGNPYSNALIKQSKGRVNGEKHFFSCLISWLRRYCAPSSARRGAGLRSPHQLHLTHPFFLSCPELMIYRCVSFPPPSMGRHTSHEKPRPLSSSWIVTLSHPEVIGPNPRPLIFCSRFRRGLTILVHSVRLNFWYSECCLCSPLHMFYILCNMWFLPTPFQFHGFDGTVAMWVVTPVAPLSTLASNTSLADSVIWVINSSLIIPTS